jgi:hypothetical protein
LIIEAVVGMALLFIAILPLVAGMRAESLLLRDTYQRAVAAEIVDGEAEVLAAGGAPNVPDGTNAYTVHAAAARNLPDGKFQLIRQRDHLRIEWTPAGKSGVGKIAREVTLK